MSSRKGRRHPPPATPAAAVTPAQVRTPPRTAARNPLIAPDTRWQRFQRYVWDRKKG